MNNEFVFVPKIDLDLEKIKNVVLKNIDKRIDGLATHQRRVSDEDYLTQIRNQYTFLSSIYNIYQTTWDYVTPVHIDSHRNCALNIPIENVENSYTVYYERPTQKSNNFIYQRAYSIIDTDKEIFRFSLEKPTFINTKIPHSVIHNQTKKDRIVMSWSVDDTYTFEDIKKLVSML
jgi:hypothetical protein